MAPKLHAFLTYSEIKGEKSTAIEFQALLKLFSRSAVLHACSFINTLLGSWKGSYDMKAHEALVRNAFSPALAENLISLKRIIFHRQQLLFVAKEALRICPSEGKNSSAPFWGGLGTVFLMANDHLDIPPSQGKSPEDTTLNIIVRMMPSVEASHFHQYQQKMMRSHLMLSRFTEPLRNTKLFFDVPKIFEEKTKVPLTTYESLIFATLSRFMNLDFAKYLQNPAQFVIGEKWFEPSVVPESQVKAFLAEVSATAEEFVQRFAVGIPTANDFTYLRDKPFFRDGDTLYPLDLSFIAEKFESGPFWRVHESLPDGDRKRFHSFWGEVFEDYMSWLLDRTTSPAINAFYPSPIYDTKEEGQVCDGIILSEDAAILIEYKGSTFSAKAKYAYETETLRQEIEEKLIGSEQRPKGIRQLRNAVLSLFRRDTPLKVKGVDLSKITKVIPLLITRDDLGSTFGINAYLNLRFKSLIGKERRKLRKTLTPLFCMGAEDIEKISSYLCDTSLTSIIESRYKGEPQMMGYLLHG